MKSTIREMFGSLSPWGRFWLYLGLASLFAAVAMSAGFGYSVSAKHALFLACLSIVTAFLPEAAYSQYERGRKGVAGILAIVAIPLFCIEFFSHAGYTAGLRGVNVTEARVQNAKYDNAQDSVASKAETRTMLLDMRRTLTTEAPWVATVKASGLRGELEAATEAVAQESRRGGCGPRCLALKEKAAKIEARIATAEKAEDIDKRLAALDRALDETKETAGKIEHKTSAVAEQNAFLSKAAAMVVEGSLIPSDFTAESAQQSVNLGMALAGTGLPALALFIAGLYRRESEAAPPRPASYADQVAAELAQLEQPLQPESKAAPGGYLKEAIAKAKEVATGPAAVWSHG